MKRSLGIVLGLAVLAWAERWRLGTSQRLGRTGLRRTGARRRVQARVPRSRRMMPTRVSPLLRKDIRFQKRNIIATKVPLTDAEAQKFWPVYDQYTAELVKINNDKYALIKAYTQSYDTMTDVQADDWAKRVLKLDADVAALRQKYWPNFRKVLPAKKTALFEQVERRTQMVIDVQLASQFPLVQPK